MKQFPEGLDSNTILYYKDKPYRVLLISKIKANSLAELIYKYTASETNYIEKNPEYTGDEWIDVVIYQCLYVNPDGHIWVREYNEFFNLFKPQV